MSPVRTLLWAAVLAAALATPVRTPCAMVSEPAQKVPHERGVPCVLQKCPKCGTTMTREFSDR